MASVKQLQKMANKLRVHSIKSTTAAGSGHPTSCMSCAEIMSVLFFSEIKENDEFILSKGHAAPILWAVYAEAGFFPVKELMNLRKITSNLEGHPTPRMPFIKIATGSLGQGLNAGTGMALAKRLQRKGRVYVLLGDSESAEGSVWEAANTAAFYGLNNLVAVLDVNRLGQSGQTMFGYNLSSYRKKFQAFGWETAVIDGHDVKQLMNVLARARKSKKPFAIIAKTSKGKGVKFLENKEGWHGKAVPKEKLESALKQIGNTDIKLKSKLKNKTVKYNYKTFKAGKYKKGEKIATRNAYGNALVRLGKANKKVAAVDAEVGNSTMAKGFFEKYPKRSFQAYIAENEMTGIAMGLSAEGYIPFCATFAAFWTRAHDFIRMAYYSKANIKFVGSHAGVSIGEDGPSQMGLEDMSMFLSIPESVVLYPSDAVSTENCVKELVKYKGISYLRTTRGATPVIYSEKEKFPIGKFKVLTKSKKDKALVIAAGITVPEALKAYQELAKKGIGIRVIDLYSVKPLDAAGLIKHSIDCCNNVIVVEDHYSNGIGAEVAMAVGKIKHLCIKKMPRSGKPEQLLKKYGIDSTAIIKAVKG